MNKIKEFYESERYERYRTDLTDLAIDSMIVINEGVLGYFDVQKLLDRFVLKIDEERAHQGSCYYKDYKDSLEDSTVYIVLSEILRTSSYFDEGIEEICERISTTVVEELAHACERDYIHPRFPSIDKVLEKSSKNDDDDFLEKLFEKEESDEFTEKRIKLARGSLVRIDEGEDDDDMIKTIALQEIERCIREGSAIQGMQIDEKGNPKDFKNVFIVLSEFLLPGLFLDDIDEVIANISFAIIEELSHASDDDYIHPDFPTIDRLLKKSDVNAPQENEEKAPEEDWEKEFDELLDEIGEDFSDFDEEGA